MDTTKAAKNLREAYINLAILQHQGAGEDTVARQMRIIAKWEAACGIEN